MFNFTKSIKQLNEFADTINKRTFYLEKALSEARVDLQQTKKDLNEALDLIGRFMDQTVLVAKDVQQLTQTKKTKK